MTPRSSVMELISLRAIGFFKLLTFTTDLFVAVSVVGLFGIGEYLPEYNSERPDVALRRVATVANCLQRHPA